MEGIRSSQDFISASCFTELKAQLCKLYNNKYMIASTIVEAIIYLLL